MEINTEKCKTCDGKGFVSSGVGYFLRCEKCMGKGELDWVEKIVGPKLNYPSNTLLYERIKEFMGKDSDIRWVVYSSEQRWRDQKEWERLRLKR